MSKKKHYYLDEIGYDSFRHRMKSDSRQKEWKKQRKKYGFDERDTWDLDSTMAEILYERLCMFDEINIIDTDFHTIDFEGEEVTQQKAIDMLKEMLKEKITSDDFEKAYEEEVRAWSLWLELIKKGVMWW